MSTHRTSHRYRPGILVSYFDDPLSGSCLFRCLHCLYRSCLRRCFILQPDFGVPCTYTLVQRTRRTNRYDTTQLITAALLLSLSCSYPLRDPHDCHSYQAFNGKGKEGERSWKSLFWKACKAFEGPRGPGNVSYRFACLVNILYFIPWFSLLAGQVYILGCLEGFALFSQGEHKN